MREREMKVGIERERERERGIDRERERVANKLCLNADRESNIV